MAEQSPFSNKCPIVGWEQAKLTWARVKSIDLQPVMDIILGMLADYAMGPIAAALTNVIEAGTNLMDSATEAVSDLINSLSPSDWLLYALSVNAREVHDVAAREGELLRSIRHYMKSVLRKHKQGDPRYRKLSRAAMVNVQGIISALSRASDQQAAYQVINSNFQRAFTMADANCSLLAQEMEQYLKKQKLAKTATDISEKIKTEGWIKAKEDLFQGTYNMLAPTANGVIRRALLDDIAAALDKYMAIARIVYMYGGINYIPAILEIKNRYTAVIDKLYRVVNPSGDEEAYVINPAESEEVEAMITKLGADVISIAGTITAEVSTKWAFMLLSMQPNYQIGTKLWEDIQEIFADPTPAAQSMSGPPASSAGGTQAAGGPTNDPGVAVSPAQVTHPHNSTPTAGGSGAYTIPAPDGGEGRREPGPGYNSTVAANRVATLPREETKNNKLESLLNASPYSTTPSDSLTIYGSNMKLPAVIEMYNLVGYALQAFIKDGSDREQRISSDPREGVLKDKNEICSRAGQAKIHLEADKDKYDFKDSMGLVRARLAATDIREELTFTERTQVQRQNQVINSDGYLKHMMVAYPLALKIHEPTMSMKVLLGCVVSVLSSVFTENGALIDEAVKIIDDRIEYLDELMDKVSPLTGYRDAGCEGVIDQLNASGLSFMAKAAAIGQVATGAVSVAAAIGGGGMALYDIMQSCGYGVPDPKMISKIKSGIDDLKKKAEGIVRDAANQILAKFSFDLTVVDQYLQLQQKMLETERFISNKITDLQQAAEQAVPSELY